MSCLRKRPRPHHGASGRDSTRNIACNTEGVSSLYLTLRERLLNRHYHDLRNHREIGPWPEAQPKVM